MNSTNVPGKLMRLLQWTFAPCGDGKHACDPEVEALVRAAYVQEPVWKPHRLYWFLYKNAWMMGQPDALMGRDVARVTWRSYSTTGSVGELEGILRPRPVDALLQQMHSEALELIELVSVRDTQVFEGDSFGVQGLARWSLIVGAVENMSAGLPPLMREAMRVQSGVIPVGLWQNAPCSHPAMLQTDVWDAGFTALHGSTDVTRLLKREFRLKAAQRASTVHGKMGTAYLDLVGLRAATYLPEDELLKDPAPGCTEGESAGSGAGAVEPAPGQAEAPAQEIWRSVYGSVPMQ